MNKPKLTEINMEDVFADTNLEIDEIESIIKIVCAALESKKSPEITMIENILFMLQGKITSIKSNLQLMKNSK